MPKLKFLLFSILFFCAQCGSDELILEYLQKRGHPQNKYLGVLLLLEVFISYVVFSALCSVIVVCLVEAVDNDGLGLQIDTD